MGSVGNGANGTTSQGLHILIVGAGIAGLVAAISLRKQGHRVEIFERSNLASEIGAAIHLTPNATGLLKRLGINPEDVGAVQNRQIRIHTPSGDVLGIVNLEKDAGLWRHKWMLVHRARLHQKLKSVALSASGDGIPAVLHVGSKINDVDPHEATITLENGETFYGDVVVGADGVHSQTRKRLATGGQIKAFSSGKNAFRFLITRQQALDDPETADIAKVCGTVHMWDSPDRRVVIYPCDDDKILNFVCIHPDTMTQIDGAMDWNQEIGKEKLLEVYHDFTPGVLKFLDKADPQTLKIWPLLDMKSLPGWTSDRLAVLGDAAHPFLPYRASGGAMAIEDGVSLGVMLSADVQPHEVPERLKLFEKARYTRATTVQQMTRDSDGPRPQETVDQMEAYIFGHDEFDYSSDILRKYLWAKNPHMYWRQPIVFGPMPGPRQDFLGRDRVAPSIKSTFTTTSIKFKTSRTLLQNLFPSSSFSFDSPSTVAYASFSQTTLDRMDWLGGGGYRHIGLYIHGVNYKKKDGSAINGTYMPILFESLADPIVSGREELGMPKLYSAIDVHHRSKSVHVQTSWQGAVWGNLRLEELQEEDNSTEKGTIGGTADDGIIVYRYIPKVGTNEKGVAEAEYPVFVPHAAESKVIPSRVKRVRTTKKATLEINPLSWDSLPTLHHVINRLAEIPIDEIVEAKVVEGEGVPDVSSAVRIE